MGSNKVKSSLAFYKEVVVKSFTNFTDNDVFTHAAALSYYTIFSLPPILVVILLFTTLVYDETTIKSVLFDQFEQMTGKASAQEVISSLDDLHIFQPTVWGTILGAGTLLFTSTTVFITMQNALNKIFNVKPKPAGKAIWYLIKDRVLSFTLLIGVAFILLVSLILNTLVLRFGEYLEDLIGIGSVVLSFFTSILLPFLVNVSLFAMIFKFLPDAKLKWKNTWFGAILTSILFVIGRNLISLYIGHSNVSSLYDTASSVMLVMVWVFYASTIVMYGAVLTYTYTKVQGEKMPAVDYAVKVKNKEVELPPKPDEGQKGIS